MVTTVREDVTAPAVYSIIGGREVMISPPRTVRGRTQTLKRRKQSEEAQRQAEAQRLAERQAEAQRVAQVEAQRVAQVEAQRVAQVEAQRLAERQQIIVQSAREQQQQGQIRTTAIVDYGRQAPPTTIYDRPVVVQRQVDTTRDETGKKIPVEGTFFIEPSEGMGLVTLKETQIFPTSKEELISPDVYSIVGGKPVIIEPSKVVSRTERFNIEGYEPFEITEEPKDIPLTTTEKLFGKVGLLTPYQKIRSGTYKAETKITSIIRGRFTEEESAKQRQDVIESREFLIAQSKQSTQSLINIGVPSFIAKAGGGISRAGIETGSLIAGGSGYIAERTIENPITFPSKFVAIGAASVGFGFGVSALTTGSVAGVSAIYGTGVGAITGTGIKAGIIGGSIYFGGKYAIETTEKIIAAPSVFERGGILAESGFTVAAAVSGFKTGSKLFQKVDPFTKITRIETTRKIRTPEFVERQYEIVKGGREYGQAEYIVKGELRPPLRITTTTTFREYFGLKPITTKITPAIRFSVATIKPINSGKPFLVSEVRSSSQIARLKMIGGGSESVNLKIAKLSNIDKYLLKQYAESITGRPMSEDTARILFGKKSVFTKGVIQSERWVDIGVKTKTWKLVPKGRRMDLFVSLTETKSLYETPKWEILTSKTLFKDIGNPLARATGNTPALIGTIYSAKDIIYLDKVPVKFLQPADIVKTPFYKTFQTPVTKTILTPTLKVIPKPSAIPTPKITPTATPSIYAGLGLYELTTGGLTPEIKLGERQLYYPISLMQEPILDLKTLTDTGLKTDLKTDLKLQPRQGQRQGQRQVPREIPKEIQKEIPKEIQKEIQKEILKQIQKPILKPTLEINPIPEKEIFPFMKIKKGNSLFKQPFGKFSVFGRRFGKFKLIGTGTEKKAFTLGKGWARKTLGATFKVPGTKARKLTGFITKKTKEGILYIEPRGKRLKKGTLEIPEIQYFRKLKGGKKK